MVNGGFVYNQGGNILRFITTTDKLGDEIDCLLRLLEKYQKYAEQHPDLYREYWLEIEVSAQLISAEKMSSYFIPFYLKLNIILVVNSSCLLYRKGNIYDNIQSLSRYGISVLTKYI
ncbi:hypothetical protein [Aeromonas hydrophila]|nr:hypothetical protein [Aeromonas hydrophila]EGX6956761.1 hypothetical protein [Aeromonas hydrophila]MCA4698761.1 hypothetical protein [Aeromonas hydrophila]MCO4221765.1 hypothetical protein [Aeromonas hydrophila]QIO17490.1 hypothetical protein G9455_06310 [Aeromonas hydrophila]UUT51664.1 hypothetical protein MOO39_05960 [Aeromonas hydrophila]